jgi:hypothetical protein
MKNFLRAFLFVALAAAFSAPAAEKRVALVIGNCAFPTSPLTNPVNDNRVITAILKLVGFEAVVFFGPITVNVQQSSA